MGLTKTALISHGTVDQSPKETYGKGRIILRIGNGGAGGTGLIRSLATDYLSTITDDASIAWVCNHSRNTQLALLRGYIDVGLTYERDQEAVTAAEGWSSTIGCAFHDHFCLAGPASDPAKIHSAKSLEEAFSKIANLGALFHSRADASATMWKERYFWKKCGVEPWADENANNWYKTSFFNPSEALITADTAGAYLLIDRSTLLHQTELQTIQNTTVFFEPTSANDMLMNSCYALVPTHTSAESANIASNFLDYLFSKRGQDVISTFGKEELGGFPLFAAVQEGFARSFLRGGLPRDGHWKIIATKSRL